MANDGKQFSGGVDPDGTTRKIQIAKMCYKPVGGRKGRSTGLGKQARMIKPMTSRHLPTSQALKASFAELPSDLAVKRKGRTHQGRPYQTARYETS